MHQKCPINPHRPGHHPPELHGEISFQRETFLQADFNPHFGYSDDQGQISLCPTQTSCGPPGDVLTHSVLYPHHCLSCIPVTLSRRERETSEFSNLFLANPRWLQRQHLPRITEGWKRDLVAFQPGRFYLVTLLP